MPANIVSAGPRLLAWARADLPLALLDVVLIACSYVATFVVRFEFQAPAEQWSHLRTGLPLVIGVHLLANWATGLYRQMWRHASVTEGARLLIAVFVGTMLVAALRGLQIVNLPYSVVLLASLATAGTLGTLRFQSRLFSLHRRRADSQRRVVVLGAGEAGAALVREMRRHPARYLPVALLDDDARKQRRSLNGVPVLGGLDMLCEVADARTADCVVLAITGANKELIERVLASADRCRLPLKILPGVGELLDGRPTVEDVRDLRIEDLLGRQQVHTDLDAVLWLLRGKRVLVTGAGGSVGSEIARQVAGFAPASLQLLDHDETHLHDAAALLPDGCRATLLLADIRDRTRMDELFAQHRPDVVFHAAAHKHVPMLESNALEAVTTNVLGTATVVEAARAAGVQRFVFISTDKAVRPSSVMGASKRLGEQIVLTEEPPEATYCAVRFGNVLGSRGSVIPTFTRQIATGGPVTVTDPRMTRFFMSISEAVQLVLQAAALAQGGEIFMLDMGKPHRIVDLAERMIRLTGRQVGRDIAIRFVGVRPGEKLEEELRAPEEGAHATRHPAVVRLVPDLPAPSQVAGWIRVFEAIASRQRPCVDVAALVRQVATTGSAADDDVDVEVDVRDDIDDIAALLDLLMLAEDGSG